MPSGPERHPSHPLAPLGQAKVSPLVSPRLQGLRTFCRLVEEFQDPPGKNIGKAIASSKVTILLILTLILAFWRNMDSETTGL